MMSDYIPENYNSLNIYLTQDDKIIPLYTEITLCK